MSGRQIRYLGWLGFSVTLACIPMSAWMISHLRTPLAAADAWSAVAAFVGAIAVSAVGALILSRHARHAIGWTFELSGLATAGAVLLAAYGEFATQPGSALPEGAAVKSAAYVLLQSGVFIPLTLGLLLFPDGHLASRRWWPAAVASVLGLVLRLIGDRFDQPNVSNDLGEWIGNAGVLLTIGSAAAGCTSLAVRWRRAGPLVRQQLKWMAAAAVIVLLLFVGDVVLSIWNDKVARDVSFLVFMVAYTTIPIAAGTSILRYGLYEIDLIINRAIVYIAMTAIVAGLYAGFTATLQRLFVAVTGQSSEASIVIAVALIATLITPVRNSLQKMVDARFKDTRDLARLMQSLETEVRAVVDVIDGKRLAERLVQTACEGADAVGAALFLDGSAEGRPAFTAGDWSGQAELVVPLRSRDGDMGRIALTRRRHGAPYAERDRAKLQGAADMVAVGLAMDRDRPHSTVVPEFDTENCAG